MNCRKCNLDIPDGSEFCNHCGAAQTMKKTARRRGNGEGTVYKTKSGNWQCEIRNPRRTKGGFRTKKEALAYLETLRAEKKKVSSIASLYMLWSENSMPKLSESKQTAYKIAYNRIPADLAKQPIQDVTISNLQEVVSGLTFYPARDIKSLLSHIYKRACAQGDVPGNLAQYIELPKLEEKEAEAFTEDEVTALWEAYLGGDNFVGYILIMIYSGMMPGELLACKRENIDLNNRVIVGAGKKTKVRKETPIAIADCIVPVIENICGEIKLIHINKDKFYTEYYRAIRNANIRELPPYSCRHTTATALASKVPPSILQRVMRHSKFTTTQRYIHHSAEQAKEAVNAIKTAATNQITNSTENQL